jgi:hypothetical protein
MTQWDNEGEIWYVGHLHHLQLPRCDMHMILSHDHQQLFVDDFTY